MNSEISFPLNQASLVLADNTLKKYKSNKVEIESTNLLQKPIMKRIFRKVIRGELKKEKEKGAKPSFWKKFRVKNYKFPYEIKVKTKKDPYRNRDEVIQLNMQKDIFSNIKHWKYCRIFDFQDP